LEQARAVAEGIVASMRTGDALEMIEFSGRPRRWRGSPVRVTEADRAAAVDAVACAVETAAWWASRLAPEGAAGNAVWESLFRHTYGTELRVEGGARAGGIVAAAPQRYEKLSELLIRPVGAAERAAAARGWRRRRLAGKLLNLMRLTKAAFTYRGGIAYALSKVERHSGRPVELRPWEQRWPWLAAPFVLWRLWREGRLR
ncbi:MAG TPA: hypothetical protein VLA52_04260, partial [Thermohalobaculum sp.]|nr:hypothetical protein [Thermohalobaculum sp.]